MELLNWWDLIFNLWQWRGFQITICKASSAGLFSFTVFFALTCEKVKYTTELFSWPMWNNNRIASLGNTKECDKIMRVKHRWSSLFTHWLESYVQKNKKKKNTKICGGNRLILVRWKTLKVDNERTWLQCDTEPPTWQNSFELPIIREVQLFHVEFNRTFFKFFWTWNIPT